MAWKLNSLDPKLAQRIKEQMDDEDKAKAWSADQEQWLTDNYPIVGLDKSCEVLGKSSASVRQKASRLGLQLKQGTDFWNEFQKRAAQSKVGKKLSPDHVAKATEARKLSMVGKPKKKLSDEQKDALSKQSKLMWVNNRLKMMSAIEKSHSESSNIKRSETMKRWWSEHGDKFLTPEIRQIRSDAAQKTSALRSSSNSFSRCKGGFRPDIGITVRSAWEANYARYLNFLIHNKSGVESWEYEVETFWFEKIKRGCRSYKPDFKVRLTSGNVEYHEVKGWMYPRAKTALKRMRIYHPSVNVVLIDQSRYRAIERSMKHLIKGWE